MNPIQFQLNVVLDSDAIVDLLVRAIEKGTSSAVVTILQAAQASNDVARGFADASEPRVGGGEIDGMPSEAKLVDANTIAKMLGVSARMVWRLRDSGGIPKPVIIGRLVRWRSEEIEEWIQAGCPAVERRGVKGRVVR